MQQAQVYDLIYLASLIQVGSMAVNLLMVLDSQGYFLSVASFSLRLKDHSVSSPDYNIGWTMGARHRLARLESTNLKFVMQRELSHNAFFTLP